MIMMTKARIKSLQRSTLYRALYDTFRDSKISCIEFLNITLEAIQNENDEDTISVLLGYISPAIRSYLPMKYIQEYKKKFFINLKNMLEKQLSLIEFNSDIVKNLLIYLNGFATDEEDNKYLIKLLNLDPKLLSQSRRFSYVCTIYKSRNIPLEDKEKLLNREIIRDKNSKDSIQTKIACNSMLPDRKNKELLWKKLTEESNSDSLTNMECIMGGFAPLEQYDIVEDFLKEKFFEVLPKIGKNNESFFVRYFIAYLSPYQFTSDDIIQKMDKLIEELKQDKDQSQTVKYLSETCDTMKRTKLAREKCEKYLEKKKKK